jgi:hypothetical protein
VLPAEAPRARRSPLAAAALILTLAAPALIAGCGDDDDEGSGDGGTATELSVTLDPDGPGRQEAATEVIQCETGDGSECGRLEPADFAPIDPQTACTEIYGGPDELHVEGTVAGDEVNTTMTRANGCEIERFDRLVPLLRDLYPDYEPGAALQP